MTRGCVLFCMGWMILNPGPLPLLADPPVGGGQPPPTPAARSTPAKEPDVTTKREEVADELRLAQRVLDSATPPEGNKAELAPEKLTREVELLKQLDVILAQQQSAAASTQERNTRKSDLTEQLNAVCAVGPANERPYSFLLLDQLSDEHFFQQQRAAAIDSAIATAQESIKQAKVKVDAAEQTLRKLKEELENHEQDDHSNDLLAAIKLAELELRVVTEQLALRRRELNNESLGKELYQLRNNLLSENINWIARDVAFSADDLQDKLVEITRHEDELNRRLRSTQADQDYAERKWFEARSRHENTEGDDRILSDELEAKRQSLQAAQQKCATLNAQLERLSTVRKVWNRRYRVVNQLAEANELITWREEAENFLAQLHREKRTQSYRLDELRQQIATLDGKQNAVADEPASRRWTRDQQSWLRQMIDTANSNIASMDACQRLHEKLKADITGDMKHWSFSDWIDGVWHEINRIWKMELTQVDDRPITVGKIVIGIALLFGGFVLARLLSQFLGRVLLLRFRLHESGAAALQSLSFYFFVVAFSWSALCFANVPLTMFTFLGGAVAIGVGFGSQSVVNNFISGLIILAERPIKVGDLIQLDTVYGNIARIGARSTQVRTANNQDIIVPNSKFLENNVVNLTLGDDKVRTVVKVGIAYGSPTREAAKLMKHAAEEHGRVLNKPEPFVWFSNFGDNSLEFELHFWVKVRTISERLRTESDIRFQIDHLFREAGITIAFPQRDVHLESVRPIDVRLLPMPTESRDPDRGPRRAEADNKGLADDAKARAA